MAYCSVKRTAQFEPRFRVWRVRKGARATFKDRSGAVTHACMPKYSQMRISTPMFTRMNIH